AHQRIHAVRTTLAGYRPLGPPLDAQLPEHGVEGMSSFPTDREGPPKSKQHSPIPGLVGGEDEFAT
ncbi:MAG: hypothetical protein ACK56I_01510, partial [bacterium]